MPCSVRKFMVFAVCCKLCIFAQRVYTADCWALMLFLMSMHRERPLRPFSFRASMAIFSFAFQLRPRHWASHSV